MPTIADPKPEAIALARRLMAERRRAFRPLTGDVLAGFIACARANGFGYAGVYQVDTRGGFKKPHAVANQAGWLIWAGEGWDTRAQHPKREKPRSKRRPSRTSRARRKAVQRAA